MEIDTNKIGSFLKSINDIEYLYLGNVMGVRDGIQILVEKHHLTREEICARFKISPSQYDDFVKGNYNYSISDIACLNVTHMEYEVSKITEKAPVKMTEKTSQ